LPHSTCVIALLLESDPNLSIDDIKQVLTRTARSEMHMGELPNMNYGAGIIDAYQSVTEIAFAGEVNGKVTDDEGEPIPAQIQIEKENIDLSVDKDGAFSFKLREGTHEVTIESFGYETKTTDITVTKDEVTEVTWELGKSEQYTISGKVRDSNGDPVPFAYVRLLGTPLDTMRTDMDGNFTFSKVPTGTYEIILSGKEFAAKREEVKVDQDLELNISMGESSRVADSYWQTDNSHV